MLTLSLLTESEKSTNLTLSIDRYSLLFIFVVERRNSLLFFEVSNIELFFTLSLSISKPGFIYPHLLYGILTWRSACKSIIKTLQVIQNKILRIISKVTYKSAVTILYFIRGIFSKLEISISWNWPNLCISISQMLPNTFEKYFNSTATTHCYETRNTFKKKYFLPQIRTNKGKNSLQFDGVQIWNSIQPEWKNLSFSCFKREIKRILITKYSPNDTNNN